MEIKKNLKAYCMALGFGLGAAAGTVGVATAWPKLALGIAGVGAFLVGVSIKLPEPPPSAPPAAGAGG